MDKLKKYKVDAGDSEVFCISVVEFPAVESNFVALAKEEKPKTVYFSKDDKHMLYGIILRADFPIYRNDDFGEYYLEFGADAIERLERKYMKNFSQKNWTKEHFDFAEGLTLTESWLVTDPENDKSKALGLEGVTKGSWVGGCLVDDNELWAEIKEGKFKGFSVEAWCGMEEIEEFKKINKENKIEMAEVKKNKFEEMFDKIKQIVMSAVENEETETVQDEIQEEVQLEEHQEEVQDEVQQQIVVEAAEEVPTEEIVNDVVDEVQEETETTEEAVEDLQEIIKGLQDEVDALKAENEELKKKNQKMAKQPSTKVVTSANETKQNGVQAAFASLRAQGFIN